MSKSVRRGTLYLIAALLLVLTACSQNPPEAVVGQSDVPKIISARATSASTVLLIFSEAMTDSVKEVANYSLDPSLTVNSVNVDDRDRRLVTLTTVGQSDDTYTVTVRNIETLDGTPIAPSGLSAQFQGGGTDDGDYSPIIPETTAVISASQKDEVLRVSENVMRLAADSSLGKDLSIGDVIVSGPIAGVAPYGVLRKVKSVASVGSDTLVVLEEAALEEAVEQGELVENFTLSTDDIVSSTEGNNVFIVENEGISTQSLKDLINIRMDNEVLCDGDGDENTTHDQITVNGGITAGLEPFIDAKIKGFSLKSFEAGIEVKETAEIKISGECAREFEKEKLIETINFKTFVFTIGPVPVVVTPSIEIFIGYDGKLSFKASYEIKQEFNARYGLRWDKKSKWNIINEKNSLLPDWGTPEFGGSAYIKGYVGAKGGLKFYGGLAFVYVYPKVFAEANASFKLPNPVYEFCLHGGLDVDAGAAVRVFKKTLGEWDTDLYDIRKEIVCETGNLAESTLTVRVNKGSVTALGKTCTPTSPCRLKVARGSKVTLTRSAGDFGGWEGAACSSAATTCEVTVDRSKTVSANFKVRLAAKIEIERGDVRLYITRPGRAEEDFGFWEPDRTHDLDLTNRLSRGDNIIRVESIPERCNGICFRKRRDATVTILVDGNPAGTVHDSCKKKCKTANIGQFKINRETGKVTTF